MEVSGQLDASDSVSPGKGPNWIWEWIGPTAGLNAVEKTKISVLPKFPCCPAHSPVTPLTELSFRTVVMSGLLSNY
jgi:hypothetical protein